MTTVLLIIQVLICIVLIGLILIQRSEGGALGIGGGGGGGGLMSGRSSANAVTKATTILGTLFILNCIALSVFFAIENPNTTITTDDGVERVVQPGDSDNNQIPNADAIDADDPLAVTPETEADADVTITPEDGEAEATETQPESGDDE